MVLLGAGELEDVQNEFLEKLLGSNPGWYIERPDDDWSPVDLAARAVEAGVELIVAAGGDGTVSAVASAVAGTDVPMAIVPFGTANDYARTLAVDTLESARDALSQGRLVAVDVFRAHLEGAESRFVLNVANGGLAWDIGTSLDDETKSAWGPLAYARGALDVISDPRLHAVGVQVDDEPLRQENVLTVAVSSGRTCGGGLLLAPTGDPQDGLLEVTLLLEAPPASTVALATRMRLGAVESDELLVRLRGRRVTLRSDPPMRFVLDGELVEATPTGFEIEPGAVRIHVGAAYSREPELA